MEIDKISERYRELIKNVVPIEQATASSNKAVCYACGRGASAKKKLVRDHDHFSRAERGWACQSCNIKMQVPKQFPVFFHNGAGFDNHFLVHGIARMCRRDAEKDDYG